MAQSPKMYIDSKTLYLTHTWFQEWNDYYNAVSASIDNDDHFIQLMIKCWKLDSK